jgi:hypothetical protein
MSIKSTRKLLRYLNLEYVMKLIKETSLFVRPIFCTEIGVIWLSFRIITKMQRIR